MPLGREYEGQNCALARSLEVVGERWTMLILRDLFFGVRRFSALQSHLDIPRAVLSVRLASLVEHGLVERRPYGAGRDEFRLTGCGLELWPIAHRLRAAARDPHRRREQGPPAAAPAADAAVTTVRDARIPRAERVVTAGVLATIPQRPPGGG